ncbi:hypothetical protein DV711_17795 [Motiliproteus coralliicola]|uniref:PilY1 beta-propeller domain-containing protein n=1 Tax=Motiliproteus coralliicola TaxID=2283196 RepID=A0A369WA00_9GAMM|nr:PilC/PilY family type IV pilus protein [Motiliproteus coralliicola]RDE18497.1 hypothetical protein DV711_17795 [Motiliproteus coralliicola]
MEVKYRSLLFSALIAGQTLTAATAGTVSQTPLFLTGSVQPNIMLLLDNSGSMSNVVPEAPFDSSSAYDCDSAIYLATTHRIDLRVNSYGEPYFRANSIDYDWVSAAGTTGLTNRSNVACFDPTENYQARLYADNGSSPAMPGSYLAAQYTGKYLNWYFGSDTDGLNYETSSTAWDWGGAGVRVKPDVLRRMDIAKKAATDLVDSLTGVNFGLSSYRGSDGADIRILMGDANDSSFRTTLTTEIKTFSPDSSTPLAESLHEIGRYFIGSSGTTNPGHSSSLSCTANGQYDGDLVLHPDTTKNSVGMTDVFGQTAGSYESPICHYCQKNFVVIVSDGRPQYDRDDMPSYLADYDGDCASGCLGYDRKTTIDTDPTFYSYEDNGSDYLDDVAQALYEIDLRPDINDLDGNAVVNNVSTYTIGFADDQIIKDQLIRDTANQAGGFFTQANDSSDLVSALETAISDIKAQTSSASAVTTSSTRLNTSTIAFQALFNSGDWNGQLLALPVGADGAISASIWDAADNVPAHGSRDIFAWDATGSTGYEFNTTNASKINATLATDLTNDQINYLRGDDSNELDNSGTLRSRPAASGKSPLGDIINSDPLFVATPNFGYQRLDDPEGLAYSTFRSGSDYTGRPGMLYFGANDGMLHAFSFKYDAKSGTATGEEEFAFIPKGVLANLGDLSATTYSHQYYVDGSPRFGDAYLTLDGATGWRTVLVGTTGAGGSGVFALDITEPTSFGADLTKQKNNILWDIDNTTSGFSDLGYTIGEASIARFADDKYYAVFGNGYNSSSGNAVLYMVQLDDLSNVHTFDTGTGGTGNGMSSPVIVDKDNDRIADYIYAGDLNGNLWKVNVPSSTSQWKFAFTSGGSPAPLFTAMDSASTPVAQPIMAKPNVGEHEDGGLMVYFGTGQYFETTDTSDLQVQTFYAIRDNGSEVSGRSVLQEQTIDVEDTTSFASFGFNVRVTSDEKVDYTSQDGWYMDLRLVGGTAKGERIINQAILRGERVIFSTLIPSTDPCGYGGTSWLMEVNALTGSRLDTTPFDLNGDGKFDDNDKVYIEVDGKKVLVSVSGLQDTTMGLHHNPAIVEDGSKEIKIMGGSSGTIKSVTESKANDGGRLSWQQLQ